MMHRAERMANQIKTDTRELLEVAHRWMVKLEDPDVADDVRDEFERWLNACPRHRDIYDQAVTFRAAFVTLSDQDFDEDIHGPTSAERFTAFTDRVSTLVSGLKFQVAAGAAAAIALMLGLVPHFMSPDPFTAPMSEPVIASFATGIGQTLNIELDDGTEITLGAASEVRSIYADDARIVELVSGAVFVDVEPDAARPFSVRSGKLTATALGTSFDVRRSPDVHRVAVSEGDVEVSFPLIMNGKPISMQSRKQLTAGQAVAATETRGLREITSVNTDEVGSWREDRLIYKGATLREIFADANRYSNLPIMIDEGSESVLDFQIRGVFQGDDIDRLLATVALIHDVEVDRTSADRITIRKNNHD